MINEGQVKRFADAPTYQNNDQYRMEKLRIEGTDDTPAIYLDQQNGIFEISGRSLPEDTVSCYAPVFDWINAYSKNPNATTDFTFKLDYFNTSSSKIILDIIGLLKGITGARIVWYAQEDDEEVQAAGEEFSEQVDIPFDFRTY